MANYPPMNAQCAVEEADLRDEVGIEAWTQALAWLGSRTHTASQPLTSSVRSLAHNAEIFSSSHTVLLREFDGR
jgi:hypothetical protein